jgi:hypothetical protein
MMEKLNNGPAQATPHKTLIDEIMDGGRPKSEREHAACREIEQLRTELDAANKEIKRLQAINNRCRSELYESESIA